MNVKIIIEGTKAGGMGVVLAALMRTLDQQGFDLEMADENFMSAVEVFRLISLSETGSGKTRKSSQSRKAKIITKETYRYLKCLSCNRTFKYSLGNGYPKFCAICGVIILKV